MNISTARKIPFLLIAAVFCGCTSNPFGGDEISPVHRQVQGTAHLNQASSHQGIYVWLEGLNVSAYTDSEGRFTITLPAKTSTEFSGVFNLYFYMANYYLDSADVIIRDNEFVYDRADINKDGSLGIPKTLRRFLEISTVVTPSSIPVDYTSLILVDVTLGAAVDSSTANDSCTVIVPYSLGGTLGAVLVKNTASDEIHVFQYAYMVETSETLLIGKIPRTISMTFSPSYKPLLPGTHDVIPYLFVRHEPVPQGLIESLGADVEALGSDYLNMPFRREGGTLHVSK